MFEIKFLYKTIYSFCSYLSKLATCMSESLYNLNHSNYNLCFFP